MNPLTNMKNVTKLSERELQNSGKSSWHDQYRDSAWIFIGGLPYDLTEGDIICIFSQYGEIVNINLIRDKDDGKSKGFCFLCYEDQRSTVLAVDNLNGIKVLNRILRVDHVSEYKIPKEGKKTGEETKKLYNEGCAPKAFVPAPKASIPVVKNPLVIEIPEYRRETLADQIQADIKLPARLPIRTDVKKEIESDGPIKVKTEEKYSDEEGNTNSESRKKNKKKRRYNSSSESDSERHKKQRGRPQSVNGKINHNYGSISKEKNGKSTEPSRSIVKNIKRRSRSRSFDLKEKRRNRSRSSSVDNDKNKSSGKQAISHRKKHDKSRRRSRS